MVSLSPKKMSQGILELLRSSPLNRKRDSGSSPAKDDTATTTTKTAMAAKQMHKRPVRKASPPPLPSSASSSDSDDDLDLSKMLKVSGDIVRKRPNLFEERDGLKMLKPPPKSKPMFSTAYIDLLRKSDTLQEKHKDDDRVAVEAVKKEEEDDKSFVNSFDKTVQKNRTYIDYIKKHRDTMKLEDYFYFDKPSIYVEPSDDEIPLALHAVPGAFTPSVEFDVYNELEVSRVKCEAHKLFDMEYEVDTEYIADFMRKIGGSTDLRTIKKGDLKLDPKKSLSKVQLVVAKLGYLVKQTVNSSYDEEVHRSIIRIMGHTMMDKRVYQTDCTEEFREIFADLFEISRDDSTEVDYNFYIMEWKSCSELSNLRFRILESLPQYHSPELTTLRRLYALSLITESITEEDTQLPDTALDTMIYEKVLMEITSFMAGDDGLADSDYETWMYKFRAMVYCIKHGDQNPKLKLLGGAVEELKVLVPMSFHSHVQSLCRSMMMLLSLMLEDKEVRMRDILQ